MTYIVVTFSLDPCDEGFGTLSQCPMGAEGPFETSRDAHYAASLYPEGFQPHILRLTQPDRDTPADYTYPSGTYWWVEVRGERVEGPFADRTEAGRVADERYPDEHSIVRTDQT